MEQNEWVVRDAGSLGMAIADYRKHRKLTQADLADLAAIHRSYLSNLERGKVTDQTDRLFRVLRRLGVEIVLRDRVSDETVRP